MNSDIQQTFARALYTMLRPMVRLLLRNGVSYRLFADIARHAYVDVAMEDFEIPGRKPSYSRVAVLTGINRKDIAKLQDRPHPVHDGVVAKRNPVARLIDGWMNDPRFQNNERRPACLPIDGAKVSFATLVSDYATDVPVRAVLDELTRIGAVQKVDAGIRLVTGGYIPRDDVREKIRILGTAVTDMLNTLDYNLNDDEAGTRLQRSVAYDNIPAELAEKIRRRSQEESEAFLLQVNEWLAECDRDSNSELEGSGRIRAGLGIYYFEESLDAGQGDAAAGSTGGNL